MTENANRALSDRSSSLSGRETAASALLAIDRASGLSREVGPRPLNRLLRLIHNDELPGGECRMFADTIAHAADESNPIDHPNWVALEGADYPISSLRSSGRDAVDFANSETRRARYPLTALFGGIRFLGHLRNGMEDS